MKTSCQLLICLLGLVVLGQCQINGDTKTLDQGISSCRVQFYHKECPDYPGLVTCLEGLQIFALTYDDKDILENNIKDATKESDSSCYALAEKGTCIRRAVRDCEGKIPAGDDGKIAKECKGLEAAVQCLDDILAVCKVGHGYAIEKREWYQGIKGEYCDLSAEGKKCKNLVYSCGNIMANYPQDKAECSKLESAPACFEQVESNKVCINIHAVKESLRKSKETIQGYQQYCEVKFGSCKRDDMYECQGVVYRKSPKCQPSAHKKSNVCFANLKTKCTTDHEIKVLRGIYESVEEFCKKHNPNHQTIPFSKLK